MTLRIKLPKYTFVVTSCAAHVPSYRGCGQRDVKDDVELPMPKPFAMEKIVNPVRYV